MHARGLIESTEVVLSGRQASQRSATIVNGRLDQLSPRRKKMVLACLAVNNILLNMCLSVLAPVFPLEVKKLFPHQSLHSGFTVGLVFSSATISDFLFAPIVGRQIPFVGARRMLCLGAGLVSGVVSLFAFVSRMYEWHMFLGFCFALRITQGFGTAMVFASSFSLLAGTYPDSVALMAGFLELFSGTGFVIGPSIGGVLYEHGGFLLPFLLMGILLAVATFLIFCSLPVVVVDKEKPKAFPQMEILRQGRPIIVLFMNFFCMSSIAFFDPTFAVYLTSTYGLKPSAIGGIFLIAPGLYTLLAPLVGYIADKYSTKPPMLVGLLVTAIGFAFMGSKTAFGFSPKLYGLLIAYAVIGFGVGWAFVPVSSDMLQTMRKAGFSDAPDLHAAIGGLLGASFSLGLTVGPVLGGFVSPSFKFEDGMVMLSLGFVFLFIVLLIQTLWSAKCSTMTSKANVSDTTPLIRSTEVATA